jgi:hypothetical protein
MSQKMMQTIQKVEQLHAEAATRQKCGAESLKNRRRHSKFTKSYRYFSACWASALPVVRLVGPTTAGTGAGPQLCPVGAQREGLYRPVKLP